MLSTKFAYPLLHIKTIGKEMAICYYFVDWNVVYEFNVIGQSFFCLLFFFGFVCPIANSPVFNFHFFVFTIYHLLLHLNLFIFRQRFELRFRTPIFELRIRAICLRRLIDNVGVRIFMGRFEFTFSTPRFKLTIRAIWLSTLKESFWVRIFTKGSDWHCKCQVQTSLTTLLVALGYFYCL